MKGEDNCHPELDSGSKRPINRILNQVQDDRDSRASKKFNIWFLLLPAILLFATYLISGKLHFIHSNPKIMISIMLISLLLFLSVALFWAGAIYRNSFDKKNEYSFLQTRIIVAFSLVATIPTIIVAIFSAYIFNFSIQAWFNQKILTILDESIIVAHSYIDDHTIQLKETALSVASDFSDMYYDLMNNPALLSKVLNAQAEMRSLDEAIIFQSSTSTLLAQTPLSFSLSFAIIPQNLIESANQGKIVHIKSDPTKIRMLIKLPEYKDTYLLIGRLIDRKIIEHIDITNGATKEYYDLKNNINSIQIKFSVIFILVALVLLCAAIGWGAIIASQIVRPIKKLVIATEKVKDGDLTVQVDMEEISNKDEMMILSKAFNRMIKQISRQQKDLIIAQRALAWSDVARRVAHEIKNPLTPIQLASERLKKFENEISDPNSFRKYINTILNNSQDIEKIVTEFVNFARLPLPSFELLDAVQVISKIVETRRLINEQITYIFTSNRPEIEFIGDAAQMGQIILNLMKNAEEAIASDGQNKSSKIIEVGVSVLQDAEEVMIFVKDNGPGFPQHIIAKATDAYITTRNRGTGLGLAIVKKIVQDHLGIIEISNVEGGGSEIKLTFNLPELKTKLNKV
jgi:two-component system, NtrC family, nitrogen regulation sensor histidine kinase NtrY